MYPITLGLVCFTNLFFRETETKDFTNKIGVALGIEFYDENLGVIGMTGASQDASTLYVTSDGYERLWNSWDFSMNKKREPSGISGGFPFILFSLVIPSRGNGLDGRGLGFLFSGEYMTEVINDRVIHRRKHQGNDGGNGHAGDHGNAHVRHHLRRPLGHAQSHGHQGQNGGDGDRKSVV